MDEAFFTREQLAEFGKVAGFPHNAVLFAIEKRADSEGMVEGVSRDEMLQEAGAGSRAWRHTLTSAISAGLMVREKRGVGDYLKLRLLRAGGVS